MIQQERLRKLAFSLRRRLADEDIKARYRRRETSDRRLNRNRRYKLIYVLPSVRITMDGTRNHSRPHIHCDIGRKKHTASIAIDNGEVLAGKMTARQLRVVKKWVHWQRPVLEALWEEMQASRPVESLIAVREGRSAAPRRASASKPVVSQKRARPGSRKRVMHSKMYHLNMMEMPEQPDFPVKSDFTGTAGVPGSSRRRTYLAEQVIPVGRGHLRNDLRRSS
jgi:Domain of unknown function (DUF4160)